MNKPPADPRPLITPDMTLLDVVSRYRSTEPVFHRYDEQAGECLLCQALFETVKDTAQKYRLDLDKLLDDLRRGSRAEPR
jgi:hypothetical protein